MERDGQFGGKPFELLRREDDFSVKFSTPEDPRFWIRFEKPVGDSLVVTDFLFGSFDEIRMAAAFGQALEAAGIHRPTNLQFTNLGPVDAPKTAETTLRIERVIDAFVLRQRRFVVGRELRVVRGKAELVVSLRDLS